MKKTTFFAASLSIIAISAITGCVKDEDLPKPSTSTATTTTTTPTTTVVVTPSVTETNTQRLCDKSFKLTAWKSEPAWKGFTDIYAVTQACYLDNTMVFRNAGTIIGGEGALKCNSGDPQTTTGTWVFTKNETVLVINDTTIYNVVVNDGTILKLTATFIDKSVTPNTTHLWTSTFTKQ
jgi:hypothetical protein